MMRQAKVSIDKFNNITSEEVCQMLLCTQRHWTIWFKKRYRDTIVFLD